ncbi:MAG: MFS transporter [Clostridia bacterium]
MKLLSAYPKEALVFIAASFVNALGSAFMWPLTTLYVYHELHHSMADAGFVLMLQSLTGIIGQFIGGTLFHRLGAKPLIVGSLLLCGFAQLFILFTRDWSTYVLIMSTLGLLNSVSMPAIQAFIGFRWKERRTELFNVVYVGNNLGMAIGTSLAGVLASISFSLTFLFNSISTIGFGLFFYWFMRGMTLIDKREVSVSAISNPSEESPLRLLAHYKLYLFLGLGSACVWFSMALWNSGVAPYVTDLGMSYTAYSFLWTVNGIVIFFGQPVTAFIKRLWARTLSAQLVANAIFYGIGFGLIFLYHDSYSMFIVGMIIMTFGEMLMAPAIPAFITERTGLTAPFYLGLVGSFGSLGRVLGPLLFGRLYDQGGISPVLLLGTVIAVVAIFLFLVHSTLNRDKQEEHQFT